MIPIHASHLMGAAALCLLLLFGLSACGADRYEVGYQAGYEAAAAENSGAAYADGYRGGYSAGLQVGRSGAGAAQAGGDSRGEAPAGSLDASGFVLVSEAVPEALLEIRYHSTYNFTGERLPGYEEPVALLTREAAAALREVSDSLLEQGYRLKIYDAYRPQSAVDFFQAWALDREDTRMKEYFYPDLDKSLLFERGYISARSGHSRGSTVDLTLVDMSTGREVDMGGPFDFFGEVSHAGYTAGLTAEQIRNRALLRDAMLAHGFRGIRTEWWHFVLEGEPYPDTYFDFPVASPG